MRRTLSTRALGASLVAFAAALALSPLSAARAGAVPDEGAESEERTQVAVVFDQPIHIENITPHSTVVEGNRDRIGDEAEFRDWLRLQRSRVLRELIFKLLSNAYMQENGVTVSEQEIGEFLAKEREVYAKVLGQYEAELKELQFRAERMHAEGKPVPAQLDEQIKMMQRKIDTLERKNVDNMLVSGAERRMYEDVQRQRVAQAIRSWKFNRLLHDQFGGRVVAEKNNLTYVPYEAYNAWLQTQHELGAFRILDPGLNADFWAHYARVPAGAIEPFDGMWDSLRWADSGMP